jgi:hypothetical protein
MEQVRRARQQFAGSQPFFCPTHLPLILFAGFSKALTFLGTGAALIQTTRSQRETDSRENQTAKKSSASATLQKMSVYFGAESKISPTQKIHRKDQFSEG